MEHALQVFLSHNSADKPAVEEIAGRLRREEFQPWLDQWNLVPGRPWQPAIEAALNQCDACLVFIGPSDIGPWQHEEMRVAINRRVTEQRFPVIPVLLPGAERGKRSALPSFLTNVTWVEFYQTLADDAAFHRLVCGIRGLPPGPGPHAGNYTGVCPYQGLQVFDVGDSPFFFGREVLTDWLVSDLRQILAKREARFLAIVGASGSGKSSLARAGLLAKLAQDAIPGSAHWPQVIFKPGANPVENLAIASADRLSLPTDAASLNRDFMLPMLQDPGLLNRQARLALRNAPPERRLLFLVDQFEELYTLCGDENLRRGFVDNLLHAASAPEGSIVVVITLRADFVGKCATHPELATFLSDSQELVGPMSDAELLAAIERPAHLAGCEFEPGLVKALLDDVKAQPGGLPLLQHALLELWNGRQGRRLTHATYEAIGKIEGALSKRADLIYDSLTEAQQRIARRVFLRLTQPGEGTEDTRRRAPFAELVTTPEETGQVETLIRELAREDVRLLVTEGDRAGQTVDVAHEALIRGWPRLRQWIDESREALREHRRLTLAADEWRHMQGDESALYRGLRLEQALDWRKVHMSDLNEWERDFLDASLAVRKREELERRRLTEEREAQRQRELESARQLAAEAEARRAAQEEKSQQQRRANRFLRGGIGAALVLTALAVGFGLFAANQRHQAELRKRSALAGKLSVAAADAAARNPIQGLLLAAQATYFEPMAEAKEKLQTILRANSRLLETLTGHGDAIFDFALSPDGKLLATGSGDSTIRLWDLASRQPLGEPLTGHTELVGQVAFSPDGKRLASASFFDKTVRLWEVASRKSLGPPLPGESLVFSPDGKVLAAIHEKTVRLWDVEAYQPISEPLPGNEAVFNPDGKLLAIVGDNTIRLWDVASRLPLGETLTGQFTAAFSPDGRFLITGGIDKSVHLWESATLKPLEALQDSEGSAGKLSFSPDGRVLASASRSDNGIRIWDISSRQLLGKLAGPKVSLGGGALFSPDGKLVVASAEDFSIWLWRLDSTSPRGEPLRGHENQVQIMAFSLDGKILASGSFDGTIRLWDLATGKAVAVLRGHDRDVYGLAFIQDGRFLVSTGVDGTVRFWDGRARQALSEALQGHEWPAKAVAFTPDGRTLISASDDATIRLWEVATKAPIGEPMLGHSAQIESIAVGADGKVLASAADETLLWDLPTRRQLAPPLPGHTVAFSPDGKLLALATKDNTISLRDAVTRLPIHAPLRGHTRSINGLAFDSGNRLLASASGDETIRLWDTSAWQEVGQLLAEDKYPLVGIAFNPDGKLLASVNSGGTVHLWDVAARRAIAQPLPGTAAAFSPDGKLLALGGEDHAVRLWDIVRQQDYGEPLRGHTDAINGIAFSPEGKLLATASNDKTLRLWALDTVTLAGARLKACEAAGRNLYWEEWREYVGPAETYQKTCPELPCPPDMETDAQQNCIHKPNPPAE